MHIYCKKCNKHTANIDEIKYDLENALEIYLQIFTD